MTTRSPQYASEAAEQAAQWLNRAEVLPDSLAKAMMKAIGRDLMRMAKVLSEAEG